MDFEILMQSRKQEEEKWSRIAEVYFDGEPMIHPAYVNLFCDENDIAMAVWYRGENGNVLYPFILKQIKETPYYDAMSAYGYGGPYISGSLSDDEWMEFWKRTVDFFKENKVVTEVIKFNLFYTNNNYPGQSSNVMNNIVCKLNADYSAIYNSYDRKVRKNLRKADSFGLKVIIEENMDNLEEFLKVYYSTMNRRNAEQRYFWNEEFFTSIQNNMSNKYVMFYVMYEEEIISVEIVLKSKTTLYSYLGGTYDEYYHMRPNDFLKNEIIKWGVDNGYKYFVLGGGHGSEDGIYKYKKCFAPTGIYDFCVGTRILQEDIYREICNKFGQDVEDDFVPAYRRT